MLTFSVIPAKAGIQSPKGEQIDDVIDEFGCWVPAFSGTTEWNSEMSTQPSICVKD